jgi:serine/threonine-protein kinase
LRQDVQHLLEADARANDFLGAPLVVESDRSGERLGAWQLQKLLGSGGMGSVYLAARADGTYEKFVAIKFLLFDAGNLRRRFALEQRILGAMTHPNIAALLDVGTDARGAPYFVMEFVDGVPITKYVVDHALDLRARVALFLPILAAMQTAHAQLVVHRDIKPSNVLVDASGNPKLLDFGIAKLLGDREPIATRTGLGPLTPEYASPEQARGVPIGTPSDIYSLGVLLYELVTGERPYRIDDQSPTGIERAICNTEPVRPSARMTVHSTRESLRDLDAIILKAMEKQSSRRYGSCAEFAADLNRWLDRRTVTAREPSPRERVLRYLYRHRLAVSVAAAIALTLIVGLGAALWEARVAREQTRIALTERDRAQSVIHFLTDTLSAASPENLGRDVTVLDVLQHARTNLPHDLDDHPDVSATVQKTLADTFLAVGDLQSARECAENALAIAQREGDQSLIIESEMSIGYILRQNRDLKAAQPMLESARAAALSNGTATQRATSAEMLGLLSATNDDVKTAERWYATALDEVPSDDPGLRAELVNNLAIAKEQSGDAKSAVELHRQALNILLDANQRRSTRLAKLWINLANTEDETGDRQAAATSFEKGLAMQIELDGDKHPDVVNTLSTMAMFYLDHGDGANALTYGERAVEGAKSLSETNLQVPYARYSYARALLFAGDAQKAVPLLQSALSERIALYSATHPQSLITQSWLGLAMAQAGDRATGADLAQRAYDQLRAKLGDDHSMTKRALGNVEKVAALK